MSVTFIKTRLDKFYLFQIHAIRQVRLITDPDERNKALQVLIDNGTIRPAEVNLMVRVVAWQENVEVFIDPNILDRFKPNADLYVQINPLGWVNKQADSNNSDAIGTYYNLLPKDKYDIGSVWQDSITGNFYQKLLKVAQGGVDTIFYFDESLIGMIPYWVRVAEV